MIRLRICFETCSGSGAPGLFSGSPQSPRVCDTAWVWGFRYHLCYSPLGKVSSGFLSPPLVYARVAATDLLQAESSRFRYGAKGVWRRRGSAPTRTLVSVVCPGQA